jgi:hypothetical protein
MPSQRRPKAHKFSCFGFWLCLLGQHPNPACSGGRRFLRRTATTGSGHYTVHSKSQHLSRASKRVKSKRSHCCCLPDLCLSCQCRVNCQSAADHRRSCVVRAARAAQRARHHFAVRDATVKRLAEELFFAGTSSCCVQQPPLHTRQYPPCSVGGKTRCAMPSSHHSFRLRPLVSLSSLTARWL